MCLGCLNERDFYDARGNRQTANFHAQQSVTGNCRHMQEWHAQQGRQRGHHGGGQLGEGQYGGRNLQQGHHQQGLYSGGRQEPSGGVGIHWRVGQDGPFDSYSGSDSDNDSDSYDHSHSNRGSYTESYSDSNFLSSDDGLHPRTEPYRPVGRPTGPRPIHTVPDFHGAPDVQGPSAFMGEGRGVEGREVEGREVGSTRGIMQGGRPRNRRRRDIPPSYDESQRGDNPPSYDESQQQHNSR